ncbi:replication initiation factor domain-containing protein [Companilactobacillus sp. DQM5]|uniref:replication initiation factor domain-containing protein n=1 Tax=Companilactobacillus sp. DQM5 TaxID=3463359 RepID=UPI0040595022
MLLKKDVMIIKVSKELEAYRIRNNYTQKEMSNLLEVSRSYYNQIENNKKNLSDEVMKKIYGLMPYLKSGNKMNCIYDYIRIRIDDIQPELVIDNILGLNHKMFFKEKNGFYGYNSMYTLENIKVMYDEPKLTNKGVLILMTGQGCREFEKYLVFQNSEWYHFFNKCFSVNGVFKRIDLAINDYYRFLDISKLISKVEDGECISKFRTVNTNGTINSDGKSRGKTLYFGSPQSNMRVVFYEKDYEQSEKLKISRDLIEIKNRYELRFMDDYAQDLISKLMLTRDELQTAKNILSTYISFRDKRSTNKKYWPLNIEWDAFLGEVAKLKLEMKPKEDIYETSVNHMAYQYGSTLKMVKELDNTLGTDTFSNIIDSAEMKEKQYHMLKIKLASVSDIVLKKGN